MAYRMEQQPNGGTDIIIDGWERGIAPGPYSIYVPSALGPVQNTGIVDLSYVNITGIPGEVSVEYPLTNSTMSGGTFHIANNKTSKLDPSTAVTTYWVIDSRSQIWIATTSGTGTIPTWTLQGKCVTTSADYLATAGFVYFNGYLLTFWEGAVYYSPDLGVTNTLWSAVGGIGGTVSGNYAFIGADQIVYFCNGSSVGSVIQNAGQTFDPTNASTYVFNAVALPLPLNDNATHIAQLYPNLLIGGRVNQVYVWDRLSPEPNSILFLPENFTQRIVSSNNNAYIFTGNPIIYSGRGNIYVTNGSQVDLYMKMPDYFLNYVTGGSSQEPYWVFGDAMYHRNRLWFGAGVAGNSGTAGVWCIDIGSQALFRANKMSTGSLPTVLNTSVTAAASNTLSGLAYFAGDSNAMTYSTFTTGQTGVIATDIIPVGTFLIKKTFSNVEIKLAVPLGTGESVAVTVVTDIGSFSLGTFTSADGGVGKIFPTNFEKAQWLQIILVLTPSSTPTSYCRVREIRVR